MNNCKMKMIIMHYIHSTGNNRLAFICCYNRYFRHIKWHIYGIFSNQNRTYCLRGFYFNYKVKFSISVFLTLCCNV